MDRQTEEMFCAIQAQMNAQRIALRTLFRTHPDPQSLLLAWRSAAFETLTCSPVTPAHERNSEYLAEEIRACMEDFTAELVELAVPGPPDPRAFPPHAMPSSDTTPGPLDASGQPGP